MDEGLSLFKVQQARGQDDPPPPHSNGFGLLENQFYTSRWYIILTHLHIVHNQYCLNENF